MLEEDTRPWPRPCHRCGKWIKQEQSHFSHGWTMFCDSCENSYNKWYESGMTDERRKQIENNEKAFEVLLEWIVLDPKQQSTGFKGPIGFHEDISSESTKDFFNGLCKRCKKKGTHFCWNERYCDEHYNEFEKLKKDLNYIEG